MWEQKHQVVIRNLQGGGRRGDVLTLGGKSDSVAQLTVQHLKPWDPYTTLKRGLLMQSVHLRGKIHTCNQNFLENTISPHNPASIT